MFYLVKFKEFSKNVLYLNQIENMIYFNLKRISFCIFFFNSIRLYLINYLQRNEINNFLNQKPMEKYGLIHVYLLYIISKLKIRID